MTMQMLCAFLLAFLFVTGFGKVYIPWLEKEKARQQIKENGPTWHASKNGTPTMGGVMFILAAVLVCLTVGFPGMLSGHFEHIFVLLFSLVFGAIGLLDDWKKIRQKQNGAVPFFPIQLGMRLSRSGRHTPINQTNVVALMISADFVEFHTSAAKRRAMKSQSFRF